MIKKLEGISWSDGWEDDVEYQDDYAKLLANYFGVNYSEVHNVNTSNLEYEIDNVEPHYLVGTEDQMYDLAVEQLADIISFGDNTSVTLINDKSLQWALQKVWDYNEYGDIENYDSYEIIDIIDPYEFAMKVIGEYGIANELASYDGEELILGKLDGETIYAYAI